MNKPNPQDKIEEVCKDCQLAKLNNPKHPVCNYHQGITEGRNQMIDKVFKIVDERIKHPLYNFDLDKLNKKNIKITMDNLIKERVAILGELKQKLNKLKEEK